MLQKSVQVKDNTFIDAVSGHAGMQNTTVDKQNVAGGSGQLFFIQRHMKLAGQNTDQFIFHMPVVIHDIAGVRTVHVVKLKRKIGCAMPFGFIKV